VEGHEEKRYNGQTDVALTAQGRAQYGLLEVRLRNKPLAAIYSSDLSRCLEGAELLGRGRDLAPVPRADLRELHLGEWEGRAWDELKQTFPGQWQARLADIVNYRVPGGETIAELNERAIPAVRAIVAAHRGEEVLVVGHGALNRVILLEAIGAPLERVFRLEQHYGCLNIIDYYADGRTVVSLLNG
jgi:alpha-ribazole phosphatase/probable phosphoglycerate mutase